MSWPTPGTYIVDPKSSLVKVFTFKEDGLLSPMAHDLELHTREVSGEVVVDEDSGEVDITFKLWNLEVAAPLTGVQKRECEKTMRKKVLSRENASARILGVVHKDDDLSLTGQLSILQGKQGVSLDVALTEQDGKWVVSTKVPVVQSRFGIKPFSAMMGMLKVRDEIRVEAEIVLTPAAAP